MKNTMNGSRSTPIQHVPPEIVRDWLQQDKAVLVDVREDFEFAAENIEPSEHRPQSDLDFSTLHDELGSRRLVFSCRTGKRSAEVAHDYSQWSGEAFHLDGGIEGWKSRGLPTQVSDRAPRLDVMRQVQLIAGSLVLAGTVLGALVNPWFLAVSGFVGAGLMFAGTTGWCGMALLLGRMPWNRVNGPAPSCRLEG